ncbi:CASP-like protein 4A4 [Sesamum alatum]|uniref:CASP-like protein n=1 Tax=Sesamum alatum TaxID=300844 RepID=A0AAE2CUT9_9LAMI|nr:CASP-like protein 4A4 [Sesamum alatum]
MLQYQPEISMSSTSVSPAAAYSSYPQAQPPPPTPSPFSFSVASTRWSTRPPTQTASLSLRFLALILSFAAALSLAAISPTTTKHKKHSNSFCDYPEYCFTVNILAFLYAAYQLFKGVCDIAHRGVFISDMVSDYISFIFDQLAGYLVVSASSVAVPVIQHMYNGSSLRKAAMVSVCMSFASFLVIAASALLSGYRLCKRIMW